MSVLESLSAGIMRPGANESDMAAVTFLLRFSNEQTRRGYQLALKQWFAWCRSHGFEPLDAQRVHIEVWQRELEQEGRKGSTINSKLNALAGFYRYAVIDDIITKDPMLHVVRPKVPYESTTNGLTRAELNAVVKAAHASSPRDHALICVLGFNGLRISEALGIDIEDLGGEFGYMTARITRRKSGRAAMIPFAPRTAWAIDNCRAGRETGPLFITSSGARLTASYANRVIKRLGRDVGITKRISNHSMRHTFITLALDADVPMRDVQNSTGHADPRMIHYYDRARESLDRNATHRVAAFVAGMG